VCPFEQQHARPVLHIGASGIVTPGGAFTNRVRIKTQQAGSPREGRPIREGDEMSFSLYAAGFVIVIGGLIYGAVLLHVPTRWIVVGSVVLLGLGILSGVQATRQKDIAK